MKMSINSQHSLFFHQSPYHGKWSAFWSTLFQLGLEYVSVGGISKVSGCVHSYHLGGNSFETPRFGHIGKWRMCAGTTEDMEKHWRVWGSIRTPRNMKRWETRRIQIIMLGWIYLSQDVSKSFRILCMCVNENLIHCDSGNLLLLNLVFKVGMLWAGKWRPFLASHKQQQLSCIFQTICIKRLTFPDPLRFTKVFFGALQNWSYQVFCVFRF